MPVKIKCSGCQKVLSVPDAARGKVVKCPTCETKLKVPAGEAAAAKAGAAVAKKGAVKKPKAEKSEEDFLSDLDLGRMEDTSVRVCPKCGTEATFEDEECPKCGIDFATGQLSARAARKKGMRGPDPADFWANAWGESWQFTKKNMKLIWRTTLYWAIYLTIALYCAAAIAYCENIPPILFWLFLYTMFTLGVPGWYFYLASKIIPSTMAREKKVKDVKYDFTLNVGMGVKAAAWMFMTTFPLSFIPLVFLGLALGSLVVLPPAVGLSLGIVGAALPVIAALLALPIALVHMTMRHSWTAWSPYHMAKATFNNIVPAMAWLGMAILTHLPSLGVLIGCGVLAGAFPEVWARILAYPVAVHLWFMAQFGLDPEVMGFMAILTIMLELFLASVVFFTPFCFMNAMPAIYMLRLAGWFGYYYREHLGLVMIVSPNEPAGFWPRYVAFMIDSLIIGCFVAIAYGMAIGGIILIGMLQIGFLIMYVLGALWLFCFIFPLLYYTRSESGPGKSTIGKRAVGLIVLTEDGKGINFQKALGRYFSRYILSGAFLGIGYMMAGFTQKKQALHDITTKTIVVWKGDDETTMR